MEIRKFSDIIGVVTTQEIVEGRFVLLVDAGVDATDPVFDLWGDLPGVKMPVDTTEADRAVYVLGFAMDNRSLPIYDPMPAYSWIARNYGFEAGQSDPSGRTLPLTGSTVHFTHKSVTQGLTVPSGVKALAYAGGVYTFPSGSFVDTADIRIVGNLIDVHPTAGDDRGKPKYASDGVVGKVEEWNQTDLAVTIRTLKP